MSATKIEPPPPLQFPKDEGENEELQRILNKLKEKSFVDPEKSLKIKCVYGINILGLLTNLGWILTVFILLHIAMSRIKRFEVPHEIAIGIPIVSAIGFALMLYHRMWTSSAARAARMYLNTITRTILVCFKGFHFLPWHNTQEVDVIDFQNHRKIIAKRKDKNPIKFKTNDNWSVELDLTVRFNRRESEEALSKSLKYTMDDLEISIQSFITARVAAIGACNSYDTLRHYKDQFTAWVAGIFAGANRISPFEKDTGTTIFDPIAEDFDLDEKSREIYDKRSKLDVFANAVERLTGKKPALSDDEASKAAQVVTENATRTISTVDHTYDVRNLPPGLTVLALGSDGIAIAPKGGKK